MPPQRPAPGVVEIVVPSTGKIMLDDIGFFHEWHRTEAMYSNGKTLPLEWNADPATSADQVLMRDLSGYVVPNHTTYVLVGTHDEKTAFLNTPVNQWSAKVWHHIED
jgi:hypothetical protein